MQPAKIAQTTVCATLTMRSAPFLDTGYEADMPSNAPHERRGHAFSSLALYGSRGRSMRLLGAPLTGAMAPFSAEPEDSPERHAHEGH
jgi:hypothetical protein